MYVTLQWGGEGVLAFSDFDVGRANPEHETCRKMGVLLKVGVSLRTSLCSGIAEGRIDFV